MEDSLHRIIPLHPPGLGFCSVFKQGIFPDWENMDGGRWIINMENVASLWQTMKFDNAWKKLLAVMLEEQGRLANGVVVSKRKNGDKMAIWLRDAGQTSEVMRVGRLVKDKLKVEGGSTSTCTEKPRPGGWRGIILCR